MNVERRQFLSWCAGLFASAPGAMPSTMHAGRATMHEQLPVRFLVVADVHYRPGIFPHDTNEMLEKFIERGRREKVDFAIELGDFQHDAKRNRAFIDIWNNAPFKTYHVVGNHDDDATTPEETREAFRLVSPWYSFDVGGVRFIVLDTNYACLDGKFIHYGRNAGFVQWKLPKGSGMRLHPDEIAFLEHALKTAQGPCVVFSHRSLLASDADAVQIRKIFADANRACPGRVLLALNGHNHCDLLRHHSGVAYWTVNSPNHCWLPRVHKMYPAEDIKRWREIDHIIAYDGTPLSAIVTIHPRTGVSVSGMKGGFWRGIGPDAFTPCLRGGYTASIRDYADLLKGIKI